MTEKGTAQEAIISTADKAAELRKALTEKKRQGNSIALDKLSGVLRFAENLSHEQAIIKYSGTIDLTVSLVDEVEHCGDILEGVLTRASIRHTVDESDSFTRVILYNIGGAEAEEMIEFALEAVEAGLAETD